MLRVRSKRRWKDKICEPIVVDIVNKSMLCKG